jgi:hypothetical protein
MPPTTINYTKSTLGRSFIGFYYIFTQIGRKVCHHGSSGSTDKVCPFFFSLSRNFKARTIASTFMEIVQKLHGVPKIIVSDRDPIFIANFWNELFSCLGTQLAHKSSYHPQCGGKNDIVNKCLEKYRCCFAYDKKTQRVKWFPLAKWWYNTSFHTSSQMSSFLVVYGYHPPSITSPLKGTTKVQEVEDHIGHQLEVLKPLKGNLVMAQNKMKQQTDQHRSEREFEVGD